MKLLITGLNLMQLLLSSCVSEDSSPSMMVSLLAAAITLKNLFPFTMYPLFSP